MKKLYIKQKVFSLGEKFSVMDVNQEPHYFVQGSFLKLPKLFSIVNVAGEEIGRITKKTFSLLPKFYVEISGREEILIEKRLSFLGAKYDIQAEGIRIEGDFLDMDFDVFRNNEKIAEIHQQWIAWGDTYEVTILDDSLEKLIICLVIAIDCVNEDAYNRLGVDDIIG